ncbi:MAG: hypothetical protein M1833_003864 [Piccolia ochrophora]|nr:MAG: hypothetical protein M1833_003864 [Piccolia ochrophora]
MALFASLLLSLFLITTSSGAPTVQSDLMNQISCTPEQNDIIALALQRMQDNARQAATAPNQDDWNRYFGMTPWEPIHQRYLDIAESPMPGPCRMVCDAENRVPMCQHTDVDGPSYSVNYFIPPAHPGEAPVILLCQDWFRTRPTNGCDNPDTGVDEDGLPNSQVGALMASYMQNQFLDSTQIVGGPYGVAGSNCGRRKCVEEAAAATALDPARPGSLEWSKWSYVLYMLAVNSKSPTCAS